jgi:translocation and assembly module TamB
LRTVLRGVLGTLRLVGKSAGVLVLVVLTLALGVLLSLDLPPSRNLAVRELNRVLVSQFKGTVVLTRLGHLGVLGVSGVDAKVTAADGTRVITVRGIGARISPLTILKSALFGKGDLRIRVADVSVDAVDADLDAAPDGSLELVRAFDPRSPAAPPTPGARGIAIDLPAIRLTHAWVHGVMAGVPPIDADVNDVRAAFLSATNTTKLDVSRLALTVRGLPMGISSTSIVRAHLAMPSETGQAMALGGTLDGSLGEVPLTAQVTMDGDALNAVVDVPDVSSERIRASLRGAPVYQTVGAHAEAHGDLSNLKTTLHARLGDGSVDLDGTLHAKGPLSGAVTLVARHIDARTFSENGPVTDLGVNVVGSAETQADQTLDARASVDIAVGTAAGQTVPHATLQIDAVRRVGKADRPAMTSAHVEGIVDEPGAPLALTADARSDGTTSDVSFGAHADVRRLEDLTRLGHVGKGAITLTLSGHARVTETIAFEADIDASAKCIDAKGARLDDVHLVGKASGTPSRPALEAHVVARGVHASGYVFSRAEAEVAGTLAHLRVAASAVADKLRNVTLNTDVTLSPVIELRNSTAVLDRGVDALHVGVASVRIDGGNIAATGIVVRGAGEPLLASFRRAPGSLVVKADSRGLDLGKLAYLAGQDKKLGGALALDVDVDARRGRADGKVSIDLTKGSMASVHGAEAHVGLTLDGRHLKGNLRAFVGEAGSIELRDLDVHIAGNDALDVSDWRNAWGNAGIAANVDLARVARLLPANALHVTDIAGRVTLAGEVERDSLADTTPAIRLSFATEGLTATGESTAPLREPGGPLMVGPPTWKLFGMDLRGGLSVNGEGGTGELDARVVDKTGALASLDVKTARLPFAELFAGESGLIARLERLPVSVRADVPLRELSQLPLLIRPGGVRGVATATVMMSGSALTPVIEVGVHAHRLTVAAAPDTPMDGEVTATYDGSLGKVTADVRSKETSLLHADVNLHVKAKEVLAARGTRPAWGGSAKARLSRFPLGAIAALSADQVTGFVSGDLEVTGLHDDARAAAKLVFDQLKVGKARFTKGNVGVTVDDKGLDASARLENASGSLEASAKMGMTWGAKVVPSPDGTGLQAKLLAKHFPAAAAAPFASSAISDLSGWVDGDASISLLPRQKPEMSGTVTFSDGVIQTPSLGEEFHAVKAKVTLTKEGIVQLEDVEARGLSGRLTASGGAHLEGTKLLGANLALRIAKKDAIPLDIQGTNLGSVYGNVAVKATGSSNGTSITVAVDVPTFHVDLPEAGFPRSPQGLADAPGVHMGVYRDADRFIVLPVDGAPVKLVAERNGVVASLPKSGGIVAPPPPTAAEAGSEKESIATKTQLDVTVHIGDVEVTRGQQVDVHLDGELRAKLAAATIVRGQIRLKSGKLEVQSKEFDIEKGTVSFVGNDPANPEVNVTAGWTAPDGTRVYADYIGPVKTGKVTLRSEPPRPRNEIVSLILFGSADGSSATPYASRSPSTGTEAGTTVGGLATDGLSKGLDQLTGMNVTTKIDTSDSANPRPEVEVQIAKDLSLELAVVLGTPPPGTNPDTTYATIDWRFVRNWSLATTFGDEGSTFADVLWKHRY